MVFACGGYFGVLSVDSLGTGRESLVYGAGCMAAALGIAVSYLFGVLWEKREKTARMALYTCFPVAALLLTASVFIKEPVVFFGVLLPLYILVGVNTGLCVRFLCNRYAEGGTGKLLGISTSVGVAGSYVLNFLSPSDSSLAIPISAACIVAAILAMFYVAVRKLGLARLMRPIQVPKTNSGAQLRYRYVLCAICSAIAIMSYMIGVNDIVINDALLGGPPPVPLSHILPSLLYLPGIIIAGMLADLWHGKYLTIVTLGCAFLSTPVVALLNSSEQYLAYSWVTYFTGGFYLIFILMCVLTIVHRSRRPALDALLSGFLFFLFSGIGALSANAFIKMSYMVLLTVYAVLVLFLLLAFYLSGGLRTVSLVSPESTLSPQRQSFEDLVLSFGISRRESEALRLLIAGKSTTQTANEMFITEKTVQKYVTSMLAKTGAESRVKLVTIFINPA